MVEAEQLAVLTADPNTWVDVLNAAMDEFEIDTPVRQAMFLAQCAHESAGFKYVEEALYYRSAQRLRQVWPKRFGPKSDAELAPYVMQPTMLANCVYANRMGNRDEASGDGYRYRGSGLIQLTGYSNHDKCADYFGMPVDELGDWLRTPEGAARSAAWFWWCAGCNAAADADDFDGVSDLINIGHKTDRMGDAIGYDDRLQKYEAIKAALEAE